jgi:hypothetical protein
MDDIISTFTNNNSNKPDSPPQGATGPAGPIFHLEYPTIAPESSMGLVDSPQLSISEVIKTHTPNGADSLSKTNDFIGDFLADVLKAQQSLSVFSNETQIITGPDGEKYFTDGSGLFININDVEGDNAFVLPAHDCFSEIREITVPEDHSLCGAAVVNFDDNEKLVLEIYLPKGQKAKHINHNYIVDSFTLAGKSVFDVSDICLAIETDENLQSTCEYFTASKSVAVNFLTAPSRHYAFDRESNLQNTCACPSVIKAKNLPNPPCLWETQKECPHYSAETWEPIDLSISIIADSDENNLYGKNLEIQSKRIGFGHIIYRLLDLDTSETVLETPYDNETKEKTYDIFLDSLNSIGITEILPSFKTAEIPEGKVYTQYVANI